MSRYQKAEKACSMLLEAYPGKFKPSCNGCEWSEGLGFFPITVGRENFFFWSPIRAIAEEAGNFSAQELFDLAVELFDLGPAGKSFPAFDWTRPTAGFGQPAPVPTGERPTWDLVMEDMAARKDFGAKKYGTTHQASNGRCHLQDAYEEVLDLACYLRAEIEKRSEG